MHWEEQTYYDVLEINPQASDTEVRMAYQRAKTTYSQDNPALYSVFTKEETRQLLLLIEEAYTVLSNAVTRRAYDQKLQNVTSPSEHPANDFMNQAMGGSQTPASTSAPSHTSSRGQTNSSAIEKSTPSVTISPVDPSMSIANDGRDVGPVRTIPNSINTPAGHGRSFAGVYPINASIEDSIQSESQTDGQFLKKVREYKKIELDQLSERTRISKAYLSAVEANDYSNLPAAVFVRGFIIQMSRALGIDENKTAKGYMDHMKSSKGS